MSTNDKLYKIFYTLGERRNLPQIAANSQRIQQLDAENRAMAQEFGVDIEAVGRQETQEEGFWGNVKSYWGAQKDVATQHERSGRAKGTILRKKADMIEEQTGKRPWWDPRR